MIAILRLKRNFWLPTTLTLAVAIGLGLTHYGVAQENLRVGVWNIERLSATANRGFPEQRGSDMLPPRNDADLEQMANYIRDDLKVDALMVTEIEADSPLSTSDRPQSEQLNRVALKMGSNWKYFLSRTGGDMRLGLLFNTERVQLKKLVNLHASEFLVSGADVLARDPFIVWIAAKDNTGPKNDLILACVHLKSQQGPFKDNRMAAIAKLIGDLTNAKVRNALTLPSKSEEPEVVILGDCNDASFRSSRFKYMFDYLAGVGFTHVRNSFGDYPHTRINGSQIDHLFASKKVVEESMVPDSFKVHTVPENPISERIDYRKSLSDHFPVTIDIRIRDDDDFTIQEAMATAEPALRAQRMAALQDDAFARATGVFGATDEQEISDDEDDGELTVNAEIRDKDFDEILAPSANVDDQEGLRRNTDPTLWPDHALDGELAKLSMAPREHIPNDRYAKSALPVVFLEQNWTPAESVEFYSLRQGSPIMRRDFFNVLEQPNSTELFRNSDYLASFGFLPRRPNEGNIEGYPVGFTGDRAIEFNCSACHTSKLTYSGKEYWVDGSQAMTDVDSWLHELVRAIQLTTEDAPEVIRSSEQSNRLGRNTQIQLDQNTKFGRFVRRLTGGTTTTVVQAKTVHDLLKKELARRQRYNDYNDFGRSFNNDDQRAAATKRPDYGFARLDALGAILNQACAEHLDMPENALPANAPVNYPAIWDAPQHVHVQWNGSVDNTARLGPLGRNTGQVIGVFGLVDIDGTVVGYDSSINFDALERAEELVTKLWSPKWPDGFGQIDVGLAKKGEAVYRANCIQCHSIISRESPGRKANEVLIPIDGPFGTSSHLGTDKLTAANWNDREARVGPLAGRNMFLPYQGRFSNNPAEKIAAREILKHLVFNTIARSYVPWRDELTIDDEHAARVMMFSEATERDTLLRYKARPLNGIWSTAPYLHNGSVLNMVELLKPPNERLSKFRVGTTEYDPATLGFRNAGPFEFNTSEEFPGNGNQGHGYGTDLSEEQKRELIEFLKAL